MIDFINNGRAQGAVAGALMGGLEPTSLRPFIDDKGCAMVTVFTGGDRQDPKCYKNVPANYATLRRDEWKQIDDAILQVSRERIMGFQSLLDRGLVYNLGNAFGTTVLEHHTQGNSFTAELSMDGARKSKSDRENFETVYLPIPIIHVDFSLNLRTLEASRRMGNPLDTTQIESATRKVNEKLEAMLFQNLSYAFGGGTIYSYINHPSRNTVTITNWAGETAANIVNQVLAMKQAAIAAKHYGPYELSIPTAYETVLDKDYDANTPGTTIRERILKISGIDAIKTIDFLPANNVTLVQMTSNVVRLVQGMGVTSLNWQSDGKFTENYKVMRITVPQIRADQDGNSGVVHGSL